MKKQNIPSIINIILLVLIIILLIFSTNRCQPKMSSDELITTEKEAISFAKQDQEIIDFEKRWINENVKIKYSASLQGDGQWLVNANPEDSADADYQIVFYPNKTITHRQLGWIPQ